MNKHIGIILIFSALIISAILVFMLYGANQTDEDSQFIENMEIIHELQQLDAAWSLTALQVLSLPDSDFDRLTVFLPRFRELRNKLSNSQLAGSQVPAPLETKLLSFLKKLEEKEQAIEQFKSNFAIVRNSLKYLPLAARTLSIKIRELDDSQLAERVRDLEMQTNNYLNAPSEDSKKILVQKLSEIDETLMEFPAIIVNPLENYVSHAWVLVERKALMDEIAARVTSDQVSKFGSELLSLYKGYQSNLANERDQLNSRRNLYILISALLLTLIVLIAGVYTYPSANNFNRRLVEEVRKRTGELERKANVVTESAADAHHGKSMGSMGRMAATLAHEINTPLGYMSSNMEVLQNGNEKINLLMEEFDSLEAVLEASDAEQVRSRMRALANVANATREQAMLDEFPEIINDMGQGIAQIQHVVQELRDFSRKDQLEQDWFDLNLCIENALKMIRHQLDDKIKIIKKLGNTPQIYGSRADMNQVVINLLSNATHAINEASRTTGFIKIATGVVDNIVVLDMLDNGKGMQKDVIDKIFEPFFTTRDVGEGTGLGLSIVQKIVWQHHGRVFVQSEPGRGTQFRIALPLKTTAGENTRQALSAI